MVTTLWCGRISLERGFSGQTELASFGTHTGLDRRGRSSVAARPVVEPDTEVQRPRAPRHPQTSARGCFPPERYSACAHRSRTHGYGCETRIAPVSVGKASVRLRFGSLSACLVHPPTACPLTGISCVALHLPSAVNAGRRSLPSTQNADSSRCCWSRAVSQQGFERLHAVGHKQSQPVCCGICVAVKGGIASSFPVLHNRFFFVVVVAA